MGCSFCGLVATHYGAFFHVLSRSLSYCCVWLILSSMVITLLAWGGGGGGGAGAVERGLVAMLFFGSWLV